ncbi:MAG: anthranilate synthase component I [Verrucomicrobiota bacterium]|nr:anthranilate synthase component I [Verrucomicrobiota bacterium]
MFKPTKKEFAEFTKQGNLIPVYCEFPGDVETPLSAFNKLAYDENGVPEKYAFLLESVEGGEHVGRYSFVGVEPLVVIEKKAGGKTVAISKGSTEEIDGKDIFERLKNYLSRFSPVAIDGIAPFSGGAVGYAGFETIEEIEPSVKCAKGNAPETPDAVFMIADTLVAFDRAYHKFQVISHAHLEDGIDPEEAYENAIANIEKILLRLKKRNGIFPLKPLSLNLKEIEPESNIKSAEFERMVEKAKQYIYDGDVIQVVLSQRFSTPTKISPINLHRALRIINPSPYMFCMHLNDFALVGASPEVHAKCEERKITVRPIAGTRKRGMDKEQDDALADELLADKKECAEHIMLVDLGRNDVGRIAKSSTVTVPELMVIERYSHVMHIVSEVTGELREDLDSDAIMSATFPAGTVSGAPKIRAMQIITELEKTRRGPYAGAVAYYSFDGNLDSSIIIRTVMLKDEVAYVQAGAGIVADSKPDFEYEETKNKARGMMKALAVAEEL